MTASQCLAFATSPARGVDAALPADISIKMIDLDIRYHVVFFPISKNPVVHPFWMHSGLGTSSRQAEASLQHLDKLRIVENETDAVEPKLQQDPAHLMIRERIAELLERAPVTFRQTKVKPDDVYLFQTGMASIYSVHTWLIDHFNSSQKSVLFGFAFHHTIHVFNFFGPGNKFLGNGDKSDIDELEEWLKTERAEGRKVQAVWAEYPSNPMIVTPNLTRLRQLADEFGFLIILDDTIGSFCNVDLFGVADVVVTSLTKSFSGYADVMGASAVINPSSSRYSELKQLFDSKYLDGYPNPDAVQLEQNSRTYLSRSKVLNNNALQLVAYLQTLVTDPKSSVSGVFYTTIGPSFENYKKTMRQPTAEFTPGYGCLFTVEFKHVEQTIAFYDSLDVHHGPHLGAHLTLVLPYIRALYNNDREWVAGYNMRVTQLRIAVGLEDTDDLLRVFKAAIAVADVAKIGDGEGVSKALRI